MPIRIEHSPLRNFIIYCLFLFVILPLAPFDLAAQMNLAWDPETDFSVVGYKVYYGTASRTYGVPINVGNVATYTLIGLTQGITYYIAVTAYNAANYESGYSNEVSVMITETVNTPNVLTGPTSGLEGSSYFYTTGGSTSSLGNPVQYEFDWKGDASTTLSAWGSATQSHIYTAAGTYNVRARARSTVNTSAVSNWSGSLSVAISGSTASGSTASCTVTTNPPGLQITVDGSTYTAPQSFSWASGSSHTISVASPQPGASGVRYVYAFWSDGGGQSHTITAPASSTTYTASYSTHYSLTTSVNPTGGGTVNPSGVNWYSSGQNVSVSATASTGYTFKGWSGGLSGKNNPTSIIMNSPTSVRANFGRRWRR
jgi:uncharacterized repeat protein (TIGR02543 family)